MAAPYCLMCRLALMGVLAMPTVRSWSSSSVVMAVAGVGGAAAAGAVGHPASSTSYSMKAATGATPMLRAPSSRSSSAHRAPLVIMTAAMSALPPLPKAEMAVGAGADLAQGVAMASPYLPLHCRVVGRAAAATCRPLR